MRQSIPQVMYNPMELLTGVTGFVFASGGLLLSGGQNSRGFGCGGFNQLRLHWELTRAAATDITFFLEDKPLDEANVGGSNFGPGRFGVVDTTVDPVTSTYPRNQIVLPSMATAANQNGFIDIPINCLGQMRLGTISGTSASTDRVLFWITLGNI